ncbi:MAG: hypothetical protein AAF647_02625 [Pseudomonadota bacterium]
MTFMPYDDAGAQSTIKMDARRWGYHLKARGAASGFGALMRLVKSVFGVAMAMAALSLWVLPGSMVSVDLLAMKAGATIALLMLAVICWQGSRGSKEPEIHIDFIRQEVRVMEIMGREEKLKTLYRFSELGDMYVEDHALHLVTSAGETLAVLQLDQETESFLRR